MTIEEAIEILQFHLDAHEFKPRRESAADRSMRERHCEAFHMAIDALKYQQSYYDRLIDYKQIAENIG